MKMVLCKVCEEREAVFLEKTGFPDDICMDCVLDFKKQWTKITVGMTKTEKRGFARWHDSLLKQRG